MMWNQFVMHTNQLKTKPAIRWLLIQALVMLALPSSLRAQEISIAKSRPPYYAGEPVLVQISVELEGDSQDVDCSLDGPVPEDVDVVGPNPSKSSRQFMQIINGRMTQSQTVTYSFTFQVTASQPGSVSVGPFVVTVDGKEQKLRAATFEFEQIESDPDIEIKLEIDDEKIYVGEQVPVKLSWVYSGDLGELRYVFQRLRIRSSFFDQFDFRDDPLPNAKATLLIETAQDDIELPASLESQSGDNEERVIVTATRTLLPEQVGEYENLLVTCRTERVTSWGRDIFGSVRPRSTRPAVAASEPFSLKIHPLPSNDRPESFTGAVGNGFSIEVAANRSVVRVGDPISLDVTVRGDGNLEKLSLPDFNNSEVLDPKKFEVPSEMPSGIYADGAKQFKLNLRVKDPSVDQLPALPFSWFDPDRETYVTARSKPIALQVMETQMISSADVVSASAAATGEAEAEGNAPDTTNSAAAANWMGANLAIEQSTARLMARSGLLSKNWALPALYLIGFSCVILALIVRRRNQRDPGERERKLRYKGLEKRLDNAAAMSARQASGEIAAAVREGIADYRGPLRNDAEALIAECESILFAPGECEPDKVKDLGRQAASLLRNIFQGSLS